jgi:hypothetical protein
VLEAVPMVGPEVAARLAAARQQAAVAQRKLDIAVLAEERAALLA